jgi:hypothetical protein
MSSLIVLLMSNFDVYKDGMEKIFMEPISLYSFSTLSIIGVFSLQIANMTVAKTTNLMKTNPWVNRFWLPIANAGLGTGAIILGTMFGIASCMGLCSIVGVSEAKKLFSIFFMLALCMLAILYPLYWMLRTIYSETILEKKLTKYAGIFYCVFILLIYYFFDKALFFKTLGVLILISILIGCYLQYSATNKGG